MNNIIFDPPRKEEMDEFLKYIYQIAVQNNYINEYIIYNTMTDYSLKREDIDKELKTGADISEFFDKWEQEYPIDESYKNGFFAYVSPNWESFCQFISTEYERDNNGYLKLYIPVDKEHIYESAKKIFNHVSSIGADHESKISRVIRSDNVVIRLRANDYKNAQSIIDYINNDPYIKEGLNKTNPFVPTYKGIGIMKESGISYNYEMSNLICKYIREKKEEPTIEDFYNWIQKVSTSDRKEEETRNIFKNSIINNENNKKKNTTSQIETALETKYIINADYITGKINWIGVYSENGNISLERIINSENSEEYIPQLIKINQKYGGDFFDNINNKKVRYVKQAFFEEEIRKRFSERQVYEERVVNNASSGRSR